MKAVLVLLKYLYISGKVPRKQLKIAMADYSYKTVLRAVKEAQENEWVVIGKEKKYSRDYQPVMIGITAKGTNYVEKEIGCTELERSQHIMAVGSNRKRINRIIKSSDLCKAAGIFICHQRQADISFSVFSETKPNDEELNLFSNLFFDSAVFFSSVDIKASIRLLGYEDEAYISSRSRTTGIIINQNGIWAVYNTMDKLMRYNNGSEEKFIRAILTYIKDSWIANEYPEYFNFINHKPNTIVIGNFPSMLPKIYTGRKWGETQSDNTAKQNFATSALSYSNLKALYEKIEFVPNNPTGIKYIHRIVNMTDKEKQKSLEQWANSYNLSCTHQNGLYYVIGLDSDKDVVVLPTINIGNLVKIRSASDKSILVVDRGMGDAVSRVVGLNVGNIYDYEFNEVHFHLYDEKGVRMDGVNPFTKRGYNAFENRETPSDDE